MSVMQLTPAHLLAVIDYTVDRHYQLGGGIYINGRKYEPAYVDDDRFSMFRDLYTCNHIAFRERYAHRNDIDKPGWQDLERNIRADYTPLTLLPPHKYPYTPVEVISLCRCILYNGAEDTPGYQLAQTIISLAITQLPGYENAPWTI